MTLTWGEGGAIDLDLRVGNLQFQDCLKSFFLDLDLRGEWVFAILGDSLTLALVVATVDTLM